VCRDQITITLRSGDLLDAARGAASNGRPYRDRPERHDDRKFGPSARDREACHAILVTMKPTRGKKFGSMPLYLGDDPTAAKPIYKPRQGLNDISVLRESC
jgi:hypothetical protein